LKKSFEKDLKTKLTLKSSGHIEENLLLLKAFTYYDPKNTGKCNQDSFAQALSKLGFYGYTDSDLDKLFLIYSNNEQYLDYQNFVKNLFNDPSLVKKEEEEEKKRRKNRKRRTTRRRTRFD